MTKKEQETKNQYILMLFSILSVYTTMILLIHIKRIFYYDSTVEIGIQDD